MTCKVKLKAIGTQKVLGAIRVCDGRISSYFHCVRDGWSTEKSFLDTPPSDLDLGLVLGKEGGD